VRLTSDARDDGTDDCPAWCRRRHRAEDHVEDRLHQSDPIVVPVVLGDPRFGRDDGLRGESLVLRVVQGVDSALAWLEVVPEEGRSLQLLVTAESARRLLVAMDDLLRLL
jgi:hypothetical protein